MIFYLSLASEGDLPQFLEWADDHLRKQREGFQQRFAPATLGLRAVADGAQFDSDGFIIETGGRRFLGWTLERHWLLPERREAETGPSAGATA